MSFYTGQIIKRSFEAPEIFSPSSPAVSSPAWQCLCLPACRRRARRTEIPRRPPPAPHASAAAAVPAGPSCRRRISREINVSYLNPEFAVWIAFSASVLVSS